MQNDIFDMKTCYGKGLANLFPLSIDVAPLCCLHLSDLCYVASVHYASIFVIRYEKEINLQGIVYILSERVTACIVREGTAGMTEQAQLVGADLIKTHSGKTKLTPR
jgi:hypothetical protein